jgi:hypothetical protein
MGFGMFNLLEYRDPENAAASIDGAASGDVSPGIALRALAPRDPA